MTGYRTILFLPLLLLAGNGTLRTQALPDSGAESRFHELERDELTEQAAQTDESPVLDFSPFDPNPGKRDYFVKIRSRVRVGLERSRGFSDGQFLGSEYESLQRAEFSNKRGVSGGILLSKKAGERLLGDFVSGYGMVTDAGPIATLLVGDYFVEAGQGIALWRGFDYGKGPDVVSAVRRSGRGIMPYRSSDENAFLRGAAASLRFDPCSIALFFSRRSLAASVDSPGVVSSISASGIVRTLSEDSRRNRLTERLTGLRCSVDFGNHGSAGLTCYRSGFSLPLRLSGEGKFSGEGYSVAAVDYHFNLPRGLLFGEWTILGGAPAGIWGATLTPSRTVDLIGSFRNYPARMVSLHGLGFGERGDTFNEEGIYLGFRLKLSRGTVLSAYFDQYRFPEGSGSGPFADGGRQWFVRAAFHPHQGLDWSLQFERKSSGQRDRSLSPGGLSRSNTVVQAIDRIRTHLDLRLTPEVRVRGRFEKVYLRSRAVPGVEQGTMLYEEISCSPLPGLSAGMRIVFFLTGSYDTRLYEFEDDLRDAASLPVLSGRGERSYILVRYGFSGSSGISAKYSRTTRDDVRRLGTGPDELPGNHDDRIGLQLDLVF